MRTLTADLFCTLDGFAYGTNSPAYFGYDGPGLQAWIGKYMDTPHVMVMGANTYRAMAEIVARGQDSTGEQMAEVPKLVFSKSLRPPLSWANSEIIDEDVATAVPRLKDTLALNWTPV